ncbi:hypothetical protein [Flavobacterium terrigena]|uniref:Uncharacterized protein n=1 Tax=Flavobacterium terrigena TaxID=402734 RepID=A0A1H6XI78_9FLAO|nr:hypothetical protein [Flavobacterium terrigena]SEJ27254.1 hypothetical protein SAMN05660918_2825 [Flavobacterium terrigena]
MKYYKFSQYLYLVAAIVFSVSVIYKILNKQDYGLQAIIAVGFIIMFFVRRSFLKKMENNQENK